MVEVGIHSIKKWDVIKENCACFPECFIFCRVSYDRVYSGSDSGGSVYTIVYFFARRRTPGKNKTIVAILQFYRPSHSEYYSPLKTFLLYSVPFRFRPSPLLYLPRGPRKLSRATVKHSDQANSINPEHLFFMIVDNLVVLLLCSCLF